MKFPTRSWLSLPLRLPGMMSRHGSPRKRSRREPMTEPIIITDSQSFSLDLIDATLDFEGRDSASATSPVILAAHIEILGRDCGTQSGIVIRIDNEARDPDQPSMTEI